MEIHLRWFQVLQNYYSHSENHVLCFDPTNSQRMIEGNDNGAYVSCYNAWNCWSRIYNQPTIQFYHLDNDTQFPYIVYDTQQDKTGISVLSASEHGVITFGECTLPGTGESAFIAVKSNVPIIVYIGAVRNFPGSEGALQH